MGAIIRYTSTGPPRPNAYVTLQENSSYGPSNLPDSLRLEVYNNYSRKNDYYQYIYTQQIRRKAGDVELEEKVCVASAWENRIKLTVWVIFAWLNFLFKTIRGILKFEGVFHENKTTTKITQTTLLIFCIAQAVHTFHGFFIVFISN